MLLKGCKRLFLLSCKMSSVFISKSSLPLPLAMSRLLHLLASQHTFHHTDIHTPNFNGHSAIQSNIAILHSAPTTTQPAYNASQLLLFKDEEKEGSACQSMHLE